ncbi:hypothetical protein MUTS15_39520 [Escherichia coli]|nr:hypothetical protein MUTS15_39520 [Escherichia coli]
MIRVTLAAFSILPELSCRFPVHFAISLFCVKNSYICPQRHQFDMAKEGYVNLLPVQHKRSRDPGDSAEMMQARRAFLDAGHYQPLRDAIVAQLREWLDEKATAVLDIGCGEGYYTHAFADALPEITTFGLDVSKVAIKAAAKRYPQVTFVSLPATVCRFPIPVWTP